MAQLMRLKVLFRSGLAYTAQPALDVGGEEPLVHHALLAATKPAALPRGVAFKLNSAAISSGIGLQRSSQVVSAALNPSSPRQWCWLK